MTYVELEKHKKEIDKTLTGFDHFAAMFLITSALIDKYVAERKAE